MNDDTIGGLGAAAGDAVPQSSIETIQQFFELGGPVVMILAALSVLALAITFLKLLQFTALSVWSSRTLDRSIDRYVSGSQEAAIDLLSRTSNPIAQMALIAMEGRERREREVLIDDIRARAAAHLENLRSHLRGLEMIGTVSPLLGLLGTVLGMIEAFRRLEQAGGQVDPSILSGGIWVALLTTAAGLVVAIPAVALHNWFERMVEKVSSRIEIAVARILSADESSLHL